MTLGSKHIKYYKPILKIITWKFLLINYLISWKTHKHRIHALFIAVLLFWYYYYPPRPTQNPWAVPREKMLLAKSVSPAEDDTHFLLDDHLEQVVEQKCGPKESKSQKRNTDYIAFKFFVQETSQLPK